MSATAPAARAQSTSVATTVGGALVNFISVEAHDLVDFEDWYSFEHFPERLAVPGFRRGRRYVEVAPEPESRPVEFLSIYETDDVATLTSEAYLAALDSPTEWTRRVAATFVGNDRSVGTLQSFDGAGRSGHVTIVRFSPAPGSEERVREAISSALVSAVESRVIVRGSLVEDDRQAAAAKESTAEGRSMAGSSAGAQTRWLIVAERHGVAWRRERDALASLLLPGSIRTDVHDVLLQEFALVVDQAA